MTVLDHLRAGGAAEIEAQHAAVTVATMLPVGHAVTIDDDVLRAAREGHIVALQSYFAEEDAATPDERAEIEAADRDPDQRTFSAEEARAALDL